MSDPFALTIPSDPGRLLVHAECRIDASGMVFTAPLGSSESDPVWSFAGNPCVELMPDGVKRLYELETWLHSRQMHPDFEYGVAKGQRKAWDGADDPPEGDGWVRNTAAGIPGEGWERFEYHEESYWRRPRKQEASEL